MAAPMSIEVVKMPTKRCGRLVWFASALEVAEITAKIPEPAKKTSAKKANGHNPGAKIVAEIASNMTTESRTRVGDCPNLSERAPSKGPMIKLAM